MSRQLRSRISSAHVIAMIALFAALGGGYASAFSGSGTLQKAGVTGFRGDEVFTTVRSLTGIGRIQVSCNDSTGAMTVRFHNESGPDNSLAVDDVTSKEGAGVFPHSNSPSAATNVDYPISLSAGGKDTLIQMHIAPEVGGGKRPQANVTIQAENFGAGNCFNSRVAVLALNTEE